MAVVKCRDHRASAQPDRPTQPVAPSQSDEEFLVEIKQQMVEGIAERTKFWPAAPDHKREQLTKAMLDSPPGEEFVERNGRLLQHLAVREQEYYENVGGISPMTIAVFLGLITGGAIFLAFPFMLLAKEKARRIEEQNLGYVTFYTWTMLEELRWLTGVIVILVGVFIGVGLGISYQWPAPLPLLPAIPAIPAYLWLRRATHQTS